MTQGRGLIFRWSFVMGQEGAVSQDKDQPVQGRGRAERAREYKKHEFLVYVLDA